MKNESKKTPFKESPLKEFSIVDPSDSPTEISDKISKLIPDMKVIHATGIIKNTESFKESKQIITNFKEGLANSPPGVFDVNKQNSPVEEFDGKSALERVTDNLQTVVHNMLKAGVEVPPIYKDFLHFTRPLEEPQELEVINQPPLFKITGIDSNGEVIVKTDTPIVLKKGKTTISLTHEKLTDAIVRSQQIDCKGFRELHNWVKQNIHRVGTLEKVSDEEWNKLRQSIIDNYNQHKNVETDACEESITSDDLDDIVRELEEEENNERVIPKTVKVEEQRVKIEVPKSINLNAYEIRLQILKESVDWVKFNNKSGKTEDILDIANKFYKFVENKK